MSNSLWQDVFSGAMAAQKGMCLFHNVIFKLENLWEIFNEILSSVKPKTIGCQPEDFLSRKEVVNILKIDFSTLWSWEKTGYIKFHSFGGRKRYKLANVEAIYSGRKGVYRG